MPTDAELRNRLLDAIEDTHRAHLSKRFNGEYVPCECEGDGGDSYFDHLNKMLLDAASSLMAEAAARGWAEGFEAGCNYMGEMEMGSPADARKLDVNPYRKEQTDAD